MNRITRTTLAALFVLSSAACGEDAPAEPTPPAATTVAETPPPSTAPVAPTSDQLAVPEDFEDRAQTEVTETNYRDQLAAIEAEQQPTTP